MQYFFLQSLLLCPDKIRHPQCYSASRRVCAFHVSQAIINHPYKLMGYTTKKMVHLEMVDPTVLLYEREFIQIKLKKTAIVTLHNDQPTLDQP